MSFGAPRPAPRPAKRLIVVCDGTWMRIDAQHPTNAARLARAVLPVAPDGTPQIVCHLDGPGTGRGTNGLARWIDRGLGGLTGAGLDVSLAAAYRFLVLGYGPGDEIYLFGFSRGAYLARSLAGLLRNSGLLARSHADRIPQAIALYRDRGPRAHPDSCSASTFRRRYGVAATATPPCVRYLGVWDTVGALGVPGRGPLARLVNRRHGFHDTALSRHVAAARHAVSIDETRRSFVPALWSNLDQVRRASVPGAYRQEWFPGDHGGVGGGRAETGLSDLALAWIADGAVEAGLAFDPAARDGWETGGNCLAPLCAGGRRTFLKWLLKLGAQARTGPADPSLLSAAARRRLLLDPAYRPKALDQAAESLLFDSAVR